MFIGKKHIIKFVLKERGKVRNCRYQYIAIVEAKPDSHSKVVDDEDLLELVAAAGKEDLKVVCISTELSTTQTEQVFHEGVQRFLYTSAREHRALSKQGSFKD